MISLLTTKLPPVSTGHDDPAAAYVCINPTCRRDAYMNYVVILRDGHELMEIYCGWCGTTAATLPLPERAPR